MIAIDTNVLVRLMVGDDRAQLDSAGRLIDTLTSRNPGLVCREVLIELVWVLSRTYGFGRLEISHAMQELLDSREFVFEDVDRVRNVLYEYEYSGIDFSDLMIRSISTASGSTHVATFDKKFARAENVVLLD